MGFLTLCWQVILRLKGQVVQTRNWQISGVKTAIKHSSHVFGSEGLLPASCSGLSTLSFCAPVKQLPSKFIKNMMLSLDIASFWPSLCLLMPSQMSLRCMAVAQAAEPCSLLFIAVRAVEFSPDEVRKHSACCEEATLPSSLPAPSSAPCTSFWTPSHVYGLVLHIWASHITVSQPWVKWQFILLEIPCLVCLLIYIQALYLSNAFHPRVSQHSAHQHLFPRCTVQTGRALCLQQYVCLLQKCLLRAVMRLVDNMDWWKKKWFLWLKVLSGSWNYRTQMWDRSRSLMLYKHIAFPHQNLQGGWVGLIGSSTFLLMVNDFQCRPCIIHKHPVLTPVMSFCINRFLLFDLTSCLASLHYFLQNAHVPS